MSAFNDQIGGSHYKDMVIQPAEYIHKNKIGFMEGSVIKYVSRWKSKGGLKDLLKAKHFLELLIEMEAADLAKGLDNRATGPINREPEDCRPTTFGRSYCVHDFDPTTRRCKLCGIDIRAIPNRHDLPVLDTVEPLPEPSYLKLDKPYHPPVDVGMGTTPVCPNCQGSGFIKTPNGEEHICVVCYPTF